MKIPKRITTLYRGDINVIITKDIAVNKYNWMSLSIDGAVIKINSYLSQEQKERMLFIAIKKEVEDYLSDSHTKEYSNKALDDMFFSTLKLNKLI